MMSELSATLASLCTSDSLHDETSYCLSRVMLGRSVAIKSPQTDRPEAICTIGITEELEDQPFIPIERVPGMLTTKWVGNFVLPSKIARKFAKWMFKTSKWRFLNELFEFEGFEANFKILEIKKCYLTDFAALMHLQLGASMHQRTLTGQNTWSGRILSNAPCLRSLAQIAGEIEFFENSLLIILLAVQEPNLHSSVWPLTRCRNIAKTLHLNHSNALSELYKLKCTSFLTLCFGNVVYTHPHSVVKVAIVVF